MNFGDSPLKKFTLFDDLADWLGVEQDALESELIDASVTIGTICGRRFVENVALNEFMSSRCTDDDRWTHTQVEEFFGRSTHTIDRWVRSGKLHKSKDRTFSRLECEKLKAKLKAKEHDE